MTHLITLGFSQRCACRVAGLSRSTYNRTKKLENQPDNARQTDKYADLRVWMHRFADTHRRWGYRRGWRKATQAGYAVGGVPLSFLSSCLGQIVIGFLGCWRLVEGAVTQHGIEGIEASSSQSNNGLFMGFLLGTFLVVVGARGGVVGLQ